MKKSSITGQTCFITGASSGIGKVCAEQFAALGVNLVITARRLERIQKSAEELSSKYGIHVIPIQLDVQKNEQVEGVFNDLETQNVKIDILINNAGLALSTDLLQEGKISNWDVMIDTNIKGLLYVIRAFLPSMVKRNRGHIINIGSVAGHGSYIAGNVYSATKHAVRAISQSLRLDVIGTAIRVSEIDPGAVHTEFSEIRWNDKERANKFYEGFTPLTADDIADAVIYCATRPLHVNVAEIIIFPQAQASLTEIYR
ncbi:MAG TPA: SDR family NAD(P)-dependent oxidoreductase, partial [Rhabdochlamydiaceae bacterium]|nr:SDR family NAD(P)-dependent oxidoreductase [Rhabdochlamydiaceae bacterium]